MTVLSTPIWHPVQGRDRWHEIEVLASPRGQPIAIVETFGSGWYANALPPLADGTSSMVPGMIRGGAYGDNVEAAKAWCERICGLHPEKPSDRRSEPRQRTVPMIDGGRAHDEAQ